jgi:hypothetical protein
VTRRVHASLPSGAPLILSGRPSDAGGARRLHRRVTASVVTHDARDAYTVYAYA